MNPVPKRRNGALALLVLVVAACGGGAGTAAPSAATEPTAAAVQTEAPADASQVATEASPAAAASDAAPATAPAEGGGTPVGDVCALVTKDEMRDILGQPVTTDLIAGPPDTCAVQTTDDAPLAAINYTKMTGVSASAVYDAYAGAPGATTIDGIGEKAAFDPSQGSLVAIKNGAVLVVVVFDDGTADAAALLDQMKRLATIAAGRM